jgi:tetratricopeptide (TPR) repeat protein
MKKLYLKLAISIVCMLVLYGIVFFIQNSFAQNLNTKQQDISGNLNRVAFQEINNRAIQNLEIKVENMEKYVEASQKNLDMWLKLLTFILSVLIGYSIFTGLKARELAKEELLDLRRIKDDVKRSANDAEDRLKNILTQITKIEQAASRAQKIEESMSLKLSEFSSKEDIVLNETQKKILDETISTTKEELKKSGIDAIKNLYYAKSVIATNEKNWEDVIRLMNAYIDLDDSNGAAFFRRGYAYSKLSDLKKTIRNDELRNKSISDYTKSISLNPQHTSALNNRGYQYIKAKKFNEAISDFSEVIRINPKHILAYHNRANAYRDTQKITESDKDFAKEKELQTEEDKKSRQK